MFSMFSMFNVYNIFVKYYPKSIKSILKSISLLCFHLVYLFIFLGCSGCGYFYLTLESTDKTNISQNLSLNLIRISLVSPINSPADDQTPTFNIEGKFQGSNLKLFNDSNCSSTPMAELIVSITDLSSNVLMTSSNLSPDGDYTFSAKAFSIKDSTIQSNCVTLDATYTLDTEPPIISTINPTIFNTNTGGSLTIDGSHFVHDMTVNIGRAKCTNIIFISSSQILCTSPNYSEAILDITLIKPNGTSATLLQNLTYETPPPKAPVCFSDSFLSTFFSLKADTVNNKLYVGGSFNQIGQCTGGGVPLDLNSGALKFSYGNFPIVAGHVNTSVSDGAGGFYIGGYFKTVGGLPRHHIAHILSDMSLDPNIGVTTEFNDEVNSLEYDSENARLYVAGKFSTISPGLESQGAILDFNGNINFNQNKIVGEVITSIPDGVGGFYIGGDMSWVGGIPVSGLVHLLSNGNVDPLFLPTINNSIRTLLLTNGTLIVGGDFTKINGSTRNYIAALNSTTGGVIGAWNPDSNDTVRALALSDNGVDLYVGGSFFSIGGQIRTGAAKLNIGNGAVDGTWNPNPFGGSQPIINSIAITGGTIFLGGQFTTVGGLTRPHVASVNNSNGAAYSWNANIDAFAWYVNSLLVANNTLFVGGNLHSVWSNSNKYILAELDISTGTLIRPDVSVNGIPGLSSLKGVATLNQFDSKLIIGGDFNLLSHNLESYLTVVDLSTGTFVKWPTPIVNDQTNTISVSGSNIFIGGKFTTIGGEGKKGFIAIDLTTNQPISNLNLNCSSFNGSSIKLKKINQELLLACNHISNNETLSYGLSRLKLSDFSIVPLNIMPAGYISDFEILNSTLYIAGSFSSVGGQFRNNLAAFDLSSGSITSWDPNFNNTVTSIEISENTLFAGGSFTTAGSQARKYFAAIDLSSGTVLNTHNVNFNDTISEIKINNNNIIVGGEFTSPQWSLMTLELSTGSVLTDWNPKVSPGVKTFSIHDDMIYIGGSFNTVNGVSRKNLASLDLITGDATSWNPQASSYVYKLDISNDRLFAGGKFKKIGTIDRNYLAAFDLTTGTLINNWAPTPNFEVLTLKYIAPWLYIGGAFYTVNGTSRDFIAALDPTTGTLTNWNPGASYHVKSISEGNTNSIFIGGLFDTFAGGEPRRYLAEIDLTTGSATSWNPDPNGSLYDFFKFNNSLYAVGVFSQINGQDHKYIAEINTTTGLPTSWDPKAITNIQQIIRVGNSVYTNGSKFWNGETHNNLTALDATTGTILQWNPQNENSFIHSNGLATSFLLNDNTLFIGGNFNIFQNQPRNLIGISITTGSLIYP